MIIKLPKRLHKAAESLRFPAGLKISEMNKGQREVALRLGKDAKLSSNNNALQNGGYEGTSAILSYCIGEHDIIRSTHGK